MGKGKLVYANEAVGKALKGQRDGKETAKVFKFTKSRSEALEDEQDDIAYVQKEEEHQILDKIKAS